MYFPLQTNLPLQPFSHLISGFFKDINRDVDVAVLVLKFRQL